MSLENSPSFFVNFSEVSMPDKDKRFYRFKSFRLDVAERRLFRNGTPVQLTPKAFDVLAVLVERSGRLVEKDELLHLVWSDSFVEESNVARIIHTLRRELRENDHGHKFIETVAKKGYRFVAKVKEVNEPSLQKNGLVAENEIHRPAEFFDDLLETSIEPQIPVGKTAVLPASRPNHRARVTLIIIGFLSAIVLISLLAFNPRSNSGINPNEPVSLAVLPLKSLTAENRDALYELGIADSLINKLSPVRNLVVRPLSATLDYAGSKTDAVAAGREQKVDFVLASSYQIADGRIRITSQLINVSNGAVEEVFNDEQSISNAFGVQDKVAANIGQRLLKKLNRQSNNLTTKQYSTNEEAYRSYLQARALMDKHTRKNAEKAVEYLEQAVSLDPNYALAYAGLAKAYSVIGMSGGDKLEQYRKAKAAIERALAIDENLAEAYSALGELKMNMEWDFEAAERAHQRALELDPNSAVAHRLYAIYLNSMGRFDEAVAEIKTAIDLEPASVLSHRNYGMILFYARRYDEAVAQLERTVEMDPDFRGGYGFLSGAYRMKGEDAKAFECFLRLPRIKANPEKVQLWKEIYAKKGWRGILQHQIEIEEAKKDEETGKMSFWDMANLYGEYGDKEKTLAVLEKGLEGGRGWGWTIIKINPAFDSLRSDPRFEKLVSRVGLK